MSTTKEIKYQKYSLGQYKKKVQKRIIALEIIVLAILLFIPILGVLITKEYTAILIYMLVPFFSILSMSVLKEEYLDRNWELEYKIWLRSIVSKQRAKQDRKNRKWLM